MANAFGMITRTGYVPDSLSNTGRLNGHRRVCPAHFCQ